MFTTCLYKWVTDCEWLVETTTFSGEDVLITDLKEVSQTKMQSHLQCITWKKQLYTALVYQGFSLMGYKVILQILYLDSN